MFSIRFRTSSLLSSSVLGLSVMARKSQPNDPDEFNKVIIPLMGQFQQAWMNVELSVNRSFGMVFNLAYYKAACIVLNMSMRDKLRALRAAVNLVETPMQRHVNGPLNDIITKIESINSFRNDLAHYPLSGNVKTCQNKYPIFKTSARGCLNLAHREINQKDFQKYIDARSRETTHH